MLQKLTTIATVCLAAVAAGSNPTNEIIADTDPYTKYDSLHPIPALDIRMNPLPEVGIYTRNKKLTLVTNVASF
jgi:hypothetical protein